MVEAFLDVFSPSESEYADPVFDGLLVPDDHILLLLHHSTSKWPLHAPVLNYCEFRYLQHLKFILPCFNSNLLVNVLKKCRMLQVLIIQSNMITAAPSADGSGSDSSAATPPLSSMRNANSLAGKF